MVSPKQLDFSSSGGGGDSDDSLSRRKSPRNPPSKRAASDALEAEADEETMKKKKKKMKKKKKKTVGPPLIVRIWNEEDELAILKGLVDYRAKTGFQSKIDWDAFYRFLGSSIVAKFSKEQVLSKIRKLKSRFLVHFEKINQGDDPKFTRASDSEAFGFSSMIWGQDDGEFGNDDGMDKEHETPVNGAAENGIAQNESGEEMLKEHEETLNENGATKITDNGTARKAQQSESEEEMLKEHEDAVANTEPLNENGAAKTTDNGINENGAAKTTDNDDDELLAVRDAFEAVMLQGLSDYQKKLQLEKLMNLGTGKRRELSDEWKALCVEERKLNIKKLRFSAKLAEAANDS
ncbi:GLABROUS1 enhancer-binding protein family [Arabidopsis suecica]|uniref:GLABROUS1 enhancer-binding protein family n=1 Tax=Arabidopsis suecica TaxID=45249 RepID=A0A8T2AHK0_ARASU|nr:GLABROUS1 enhancer-binding protein family [Arabidopsis suecica]